jgi:lipopolysaccharide export system permease protein
LLAFAKTQSGGIGRVLLDYYGPRVLVLFDQLAGLIAMVAAMLSITLLQRHQELTALMAAGISKMRAAKPLLVGAVLVSLLGVLNREWLLPRVRDRLAYNAQDLSGEMGRVLHPRYDNYTLIMISGAKAFSKERRILKPQFRLPGEFAEWGPKISGQEAFYQRANEHHPAGYLVKGVSQPKDLAETPTAQFNNAPVLLSPMDQSWLQPDECFVVSEMSFESLVGNTSLRNYFGTAELIAGLNNKSLDFGNDVKVIVHSRFLQPLVDITVFFLGLPLVLGRENRNIFVASGICLSVVTAFLVVSLASHAAGANYLVRPVFAAWLPFIIFGPASYSLAKPLWD